MNGWELFGRWLVIIGMALAVLGGLVWLAGKLLGGHELPGTLRIQIPGGTVIIPLLGMIVVSVVLTVLLNLIARLFHR